MFRGTNMSSNKPVDNRSFTGWICLAMYAVARSSFRAALRLPQLA